MKVRFRSLAPVAALTLVLAAGDLAAATKHRLLSVVPTDATSVGFVRLDAMKASPLAGRLFSETNKATMDDDAKRFLEEAGVKVDDIDTIVFAMSPKDGAQQPDILVAAEGRFDPTRLASAVAKRGALPKTQNGRTYYVISDGNDSGAVCFWDKTTVFAGSESAVSQTIDSMLKGGTNFAAASGLGMELARIDRDAECWMIMDVPRSARLHHTPDAAGKAPMSTDAIAGAMKRVSTVAVWATETRDALQFGATAVSSDEETRALLEDMIRGLTASWRMAAQEKHPELVKIIRQFEVGNTRDAVTISGSIPVEFLKNFATKVQQQAAK